MHRGWAPPLHFLEWAVAEHAGGEGLSGDRCVVAPFPGGAVLGVVDGLGRGSEADHAARTAVEVIRRDAGVPLGQLFHACHDAVRTTRGVTMTLASVDAVRSTATWGGIGNVEGRIVRGSGPERRGDTALRLAGVVGFILPRLQPRTVDLLPGDLVVLATNGVSPAFAAPGEPVDRGDDVRDVAARILDRHHRGGEALVLVARFTGT